MYLQQKALIEKCSLNKGVYKKRLCTALLCPFDENS